MVSTTYCRWASAYSNDSFPAENSARHVRQNPLPIASIYIIGLFSFRQDNRTQNPRGVLPGQRSAGISDWFMAAPPPFPCGCSTPPVLRLMLVRVVVEISEYQYFKTFLTCLYYIPIVLDNDSFDLSCFGQPDHLIPARTVKCYPGHTIVNEELWIRETVVGCVLQKDFLLERDLSRVNYTLCPTGTLISS